LAVVSSLVVAVVGSLCLKSLLYSHAVGADATASSNTTSPPSTLLGGLGHWGGILASETSVEILPVGSKRDRFSPKKENVSIGKIVQSPR